MTLLPAVVTAGQAGALTAAALGAAAVLVLREPRARAVAMLVALLLAVVAIVALKAHTVSNGISDHRALALAGAVIGLAGLAVVTEIMRRRPQVFALLAFAALPFRVPVTIGTETSNLLLPLYGVIGAGALAFALRQWRRTDEPQRDPEGTPGARALRRVEVALAVVVVLYAVQSAYSSDVSQATISVCCFYVPFAVLFRLLLDVPWTNRLLRQVFGVVVVLALLFAAVGFVEAATGRLLISNSKVLAANEVKPYFRVNSLFFDPNIYGRFLALTMIVLAVLRWRALIVGGVVLVALVVGLAVAIAAPDQVGLDTGSSKGLDSSTSGRTDLIKGGARMARDRPVYGFGSGSFAKDYRRREHVHSEKSAAVSHTIPVTVAAEQGVIGLAAYLWLLFCAFALLFGGLRRAVRAGPPSDGIGRAAMAAAYAGLVLHTFVYAAFLEDPLSWVLLAIGAVLRLSGEVRERRRSPAGGGELRSPETEPVPA